MLGDSISFEELDHAEKLLQHFCLMFSALYSAGKETINIHSLLHLADDVRNLGPLWTHSCFPFESYNGNLLKLFHGTQNVELQIVSSVAITQSLPSLKLKLIPGSVEEEFFNSLMNPSHVGREQIIENNIAALGSPSMKTLDREQIIALGKFLGFPSLLDTFPSFKRVRIGGSVYHSLSYKRVTARNSYTVLFQDNGPHCNNFLVGQIDFYFQYKPPCDSNLSCAEYCVCPVKNLALVYAFTRVPGFAFIEDPITFATGQQLTAVYAREKVIMIIPISAVKEKLVYMQCEGEEVAFVSRFPNRVESD